MPAKAKPRAREAAAPLDRAAWIEAGFDVLAEGGIDAVRVDPLAKRLKVTRGSFYWHFKDRADLHQAMLREWRRRASYQVYVRVERTAEPARARLERLALLPFAGERAQRAAAIELAVRLWARRDTDAAKAVRFIDRTRLKYFTALMREQKISDTEAADRAYLFYAHIMAEAFIAVDRNDERLKACQDILLP